MRLCVVNAPFSVLSNGQPQARRQDLKILVMSATLDVAKFVRYFPGAAAARIQGRQHPVQVMYTPTPEPSYMEAALIAAAQVHVRAPPPVEGSPGDVLVFLTGQDEIEAMERLLHDRYVLLKSCCAKRTRCAHE